MAEKKDEDPFADLMADSESEDVIAADDSAQPAADSAAGEDAFADAVAAELAENDAPPDIGESAPDGRAPEESTDGPVPDFDIDSAIPPEGDEDGGEDGPKTPLWKQRKVQIAAAAGALLLVATGGGLVLFGGGDPADMQDEAAVDLASIREATRIDGVPALRIGLPKPENRPQPAPLRRDGQSPPSDNSGVTPESTPDTAEATVAMPNATRDPDTQSTTMPATDDTRFEPGIAEIAPRFPLPQYPEPLLSPKGFLQPPTFATLSARDDKDALPEAPIEALHEETPLGPLPIIAGDRTVFEAYARPAPDENADWPKVAIVITDLTRKPEPLAAATASLPPAVTLTISPYAENPGAAIAAARGAGHETLIAVPMEPSSFPARDPGPLGLLTVLAETENIGRMETVLAKGAGYIGITPFMGEAFTRDPAALNPVLEALRQRGLFYFAHDRMDAIRLMSDLRLPHAIADFQIDEKPFRKAVDARLEHLVLMAREEGSAIGRAEGSALVLERLTEWFATLEDRQIQLVPVSALARTQPEGDDTAVSMAAPAGETAIQDGSSETPDGTGKPAPVDAPATATESEDATRSGA